MLRHSLAFVCLAAVLLASGCGTLGRYNDQPTLTIAGPPQTPAEAVRDLFTSRPTPYRVTLSEADPDTGEPIPDENGLSALGVGGLFLPLVFDFTAFDIESVEPTDDGIAFTARLESEVNLIPTWQGKVHGQVATDDQGVVRLTFRPFYANWVVIGNVIAGAKLSFETLDLAADRFTGYYTVSFFGTGNATGSGYYQGTLGPIENETEKVKK